MLIVVKQATRKTLTVDHLDNHSDKSFCEIHYCLSNGGGLGGMVGLSHLIEFTWGQITKNIVALFRRWLYPAHWHRSWTHKELRWEELYPAGSSVHVWTWPTLEDPARNECNSQVPGERYSGLSLACLACEWFWGSHIANSTTAPGGYPEVWSVDGVSVTVWFSSRSWLWTAADGHHRFEFPSTAFNSWSPSRGFWLHFGHWKNVSALSSCTFWYFLLTFATSNVS